MEFVDLNRSFVAIANDSESNLLIGRVWGRRIGGWLEWSDLLNYPRVVLLAEAASGKTEEFRHTASALRARGNRAFYCTIEQLADRELAASLDPAERAALTEWKSGTEVGWFFLDSVDEARLNRKRFEDALRRLADDLCPAMSRACVLVSCRISDWKGNSDRLALQRLLLSSPLRW